MKEQSKAISLIVSWVY